MTIDEIGLQEITNRPNSERLENLFEEIKKDVESNKQSALDGLELLGIEPENVEDLEGWGRKKEDNYFTEEGGIRDVFREVRDNINNYNSKEDQRAYISPLLYVLSEVIVDDKNVKEEIIRNFTTSILSTFLIPLSGLPKGEYVMVFTSLTAIFYATQAVKRNQNPEERRAFMEEIKKQIGIIKYFYRHS